MIRICSAREWTFLDFKNSLERIGGTAQTASINSMASASTSFVSDIIGISHSPKNGGWLDSIKRRRPSSKSLPAPQPLKRYA
jgi:hypothetical protein